MHHSLPVDSERAIDALVGDLKKMKECADGVACGASFALENLGAKLGRAESHAT